MTAETIFCAPFAAAPAAPLAPVAPGPALPLSWLRANVAQPAVSIARLPLSRVSWVTAAELPMSYSFARAYDEILARMPGPFLVRGCGPELAAFLAARGCDTLGVGVEGVLDLSTAGQARPAVIKMLKAGRRHGAVHELAWSEANQAEVARLGAAARHGARPQLRHLFRTEFSPDTRCLVFVGSQGAWLGALLISQPHHGAAVTELMLRRPDAPGGVMECLFVAAGECLRAEGVQSLSLNEVPFFTPPGRRGPREQLVARIGRGMRGAYNAEGLLRFKDKFGPAWRPVYLCASTRISLLLLGELFAATGCLDLVGHSLLRGKEQD